MQQRRDESAQEPLDVVGARVDVRDVAAGAERPTLAAQHERAHPGLLGRAVGVVERGDVIGVQRVEPIGCIEHDLGDTVAQGGTDHHGFSPYTS